MLSKLISQISIGVMLVGIIGVGLTTKSMGTISKHPVAVNVSSCINGLYWKTSIGIRT